MDISTWLRPARWTRSTTAAPERTRPGRRFLAWAGGTVAALLALGTVGALYETAAEARDARAFTPPGQMVDVGGHRLHLDCVGTGSPTCTSLRPSL